MRSRTSLKRMAAFAAVVAMALAVAAVVSGALALTILFISTVAAAACLAVVAVLLSVAARIEARLDAQTRLISQARASASKSREVAWQVRRELTAVRATLDELSHRRTKPLEIDRGPLIRDINAMMTLTSSLRPSGEVHQWSSWAATPETLLFVTAEVTSGRARTVLEVGSGLSTVWLALAARACPHPVRIVSLEHDLTFSKQTSDALARNGLAEFVEVRTSPLEKISVDGQDFLWYSVDAIADLDDIDLVFVDGPPAATGHFARYPAYPLLARHLAPSALVVLDDTGRDDERAILTSWMKAGGAILSIERELDRATALRHKSSPDSV